MAADLENGSGADCAEGVCDARNALGFEASAASTDSTGPCRANEPGNEFDDPKLIPQ